MITLMDHGNVAGSVSVDASTYRTHYFVLTDDITLGPPTGLDDGESVVLIFKSDHSPYKQVTFDSAYGTGPTSVDYVSPAKREFTKVGASFIG